MCSEKNISVVYKIRRKSDGYFSTGTSSPSFIKEGGKTWSKGSALKAHLTLVKNNHKALPKSFRFVYEDSESVKYLITEIGSMTIEL